jgi:glycosyltransferase involved in cell wall biosynthesis
MSRPLVTVLMAVHNTDAYLLEAIDSVLAQTLQDLELVIVDDGSSDGSWSIIEAATARDRRVVARRRLSSGGASRALNDGLAICGGEYITRQDGDDVSLPQRLAEQVAFLEREPKSAAVGTQAILIDETGKRLSETRFPTADDRIQATLVESMCFVGPTVMARRTAFERAGLWFDDALSGTEDYDQCLRLAEVGTLGNLASSLYLYRQHAASVSHRQRHQQLSRKAQAVERAVRRRYGAEAPAEAWIDVARDYLRAAVVAQATEEAEASRRWVDKATSFYPRIFDDTALVERVIRRYLPSVPADARVRFAETLFDATLPVTRDLRALRRQLVAELQLSALVTRGGQPDGVSGHLWPAIRSNPTWLLKREVLGLLMRSAMGRARHEREAAPVKPGAREI